MVGINIGNTEVKELFGGLEMIDCMDADHQTGRLPEVEPFGGGDSIKEGDIFDTTCLGESSDVFGGPIGILIESVDDGFPGVDIHDPGEHIGEINLNNEAVENGLVERLSGGAEVPKEGTRGCFVGIFSVSDDIDVGVAIKEVEQVVERDGMKLSLNEGRVESIDGGFGWVMDEDDAVVACEREIQLKEAVAELIIKKERLIRIGVSMTKNAAASVGNIGVKLSPGIVKTVICD